MAGIENLFAIEPTLPSVQGMKLPEQTERWSEVMTTHLRELYPDAANLPIMVEFRKRDDQTGTCIGAMHVSDDNAKKTILVPFVVHDFEMKPLDIWMEKEKQVVHPLSKDTFKEQFFSTRAGSLDARPGDSAGQYFNDPSLWTTNYPPLQGRYSYASAGYQLLDQMSDSFTKEDGENFKNALRNDPAMIARFNENGHGEIIEKLARKTYPNTNDYVASAAALIPVSVADIKREGQDKYSLLSSVSGLFDTMQTLRMDREALHKFLSKITGAPQDVLNELDQEGEKMLVIRKPSDSVFLYDQMEAKAENADKFDCYVVKNKNGLEVEGVVLPYVVNFSGKKVNKKLFVSPTHSAVQSTIAGIPVKGSLALQKSLKGCDANIGQTGTFVYLDDGKAIATEPVTITAIEDHGWKFSVVDLEGKKFKVRRGYGNYFEKEEMESGASNTIAGSSGVEGKVQFKRTYLDAHGIIEARQGIHIIPEKMIWVPMQPVADITATPNEYMQKVAFARMEANPMEVRYTGIVYNIRTPEFQKEASERETRVLLANAGVPVEKIAGILKRAKVHGKAKIHGADKLTSMDSKKKEFGSLIVKISQACAELKKHNFLKEASYIHIKKASDARQSQTVDALLSLNFINPENVAKFAAYKPVFEKVVDYLAELVLASRLGFNEIPEYATVSAMNKLQEVIVGLEKLEMSLKKPSTKTT